MRPALPLVLAAALASGSPAGAAAPCAAASGPQRATLIELYTSEGCDSCPPADRWLSALATATNPERPLVPLAFHVPYWDNLGWRDRFAAPDFAARQEAHRRANRGSSNYTPQTVVDGRDSQAWRQGAGRPRTGEAKPAAAELRLSADPIPGSLATVRLQARLLPAASGPAVAYLALYENGLVSAVQAGENAGRQLRHDYVVREWIGPLAFDAGGRLDIHHRFAREDVPPDRAGIAAVVESADGSVYHQALALPLCR